MEAMDIYSQEKLTKIKLRTLEVKIAERVFNMDVSRRTDGCGNVLSANLKLGGEEVSEPVPFFASQWEDCRNVMQHFAFASMDTKALYLNRLHVYASRRAGDKINPGISLLGAGWLTCEDICRAALDVLDGVVGPLPELESVF